MRALTMPARLDFIGRQLDGELHELVLSRGKTGFVALHSFEETDDVLLVLAIRHQREAGYGVATAPQVLKPHSAPRLSGSNSD